jgi:hypothetical protein
MRSKPVSRSAPTSVTQKTQAYCGVASMVTILNALGVLAPARPECAPSRTFCTNSCPPKCNFELGLSRRRSRALICKQNSKRVPFGGVNSLGESRLSESDFEFAAHVEVNSLPPDTAHFLGSSRPIRGRRDYPHRACWRRERNCRQTLSAAFSMTYEPHEARWMLPRESWIRSCSLRPHLQH